MPTALIVEDEPEANELLAMLVRLRGYEAESAFTGEEAISKVQDERPDILFLDLMLPDITGYDVCESLKSRRATNSIPIVMVTARLASENRRQGFRLGANEYIPKPYTPDQIFQAMSAADCWSKSIDKLADSGSFRIDPADDLSPLRRVSDLRSLLLRRSSIAEQTATNFARSLGEVLQRGLDWGRRRSIDHVAALDYRLDQDRLVVEIRDGSGWFLEDHPDEDGLAKAIEEGRFGRVDYDPNSATLRLDSEPLRSEEMGTGPSRQALDGRSAAS